MQRSNEAIQTYFMSLRLFIIFTFLFNLVLNSQIISQFEFDSNPVTTATIGPDASSISSSATSTPGGVGGTNGLNAGLPKMDIEMVIPGSPTFDVAGIDVSFDYQRDENSGQFFERGQSLRMNGLNNFSVNYRVQDGFGGYTQVNSGSVFSIPNDNVFRNYRFIYTPCDGIGMLLVDNTLIWMNDGPDNRDMYWNTTDDVEFGRGMDGTGSNRAMVDNLIVGEVNCSPLPVDFLTISAELLEDRTVSVNWSCETETNNSHYIIQRKIDTLSWKDVGSIDGAGNSTQVLFYNFIDLEPLDNLSYYRVKQVDYDGQFTYSPIASVEINTTRLKVYPNPSNGHFIIDYSADNQIDNEYFIYDYFGRTIFKGFLQNNKEVALDLSEQPEGIYFVKVGENVERIVKR